MSDRREALELILWNLIAGDITMDQAVVMLQKLYARQA